jgi:hypothetical protein
MDSVDAESESKAPCQNRWKKAPKTKTASTSNWIATVRSTEKTVPNVSKTGALFSAFSFKQTRATISAGAPKQ